MTAGPARFSTRSTIAASSAAIPAASNVYVATGDSGQGMTHGALAGLLIKDLIVDGTSPWEEVYEPSRKPPIGHRQLRQRERHGGEELRRICHAGRARHRSTSSKPGQGGIIREGLSKIAACRDASGKLHLHSAICTHLGCHVHWNSTEQCWDCPCHGSHFAPDGAVLNGPAIKPLAAAKAKVKA